VGVYADTTPRDAVTTGSIEAKLQLATPAADTLNVQVVLAPASMAASVQDHCEVESGDTTTVKFTVLSAVR